MRIALQSVVRLGWFASTLLLTACAQDRIRKESTEQMRGGAFEKAVEFLDQGLKQHPESATLKSGLVLARNEALARLLTESAAARAAGQLDEAESLLYRAQTFDTGGKRVEALLADLQTERRQKQALEQADALLEQGRTDAAARVVGNALTDNPRHAELLRLKRRLEIDARQSQQKAAQLGLSEVRPISIDFRDASLRTVLDVITRNSGVNFVIDKDVRADIRVSVLLRSAKLEDAVDLIVSTNGLAKKITDSNTILIYPNTPEKQREYQEQVIRVFHLASADAKGAAAFLRSMMKVKDPFVDERSNMLSLRESPETIELAERLLALYDTAEPEVLLELEVIEVSTNRLLELGVNLPTNFSLTLLGAGSGNGGAGSTGGGGLKWNDFKNITGNRVGVGVGNVLVNFSRQLGDVNTLANPKVRVKNKEKAKVMIGDKVPVITATTGQGGFVSDSVSYIDVGLKLDVEPHVFADDEVAIKVGLEVSTLAQQVKTASGSLAYQIGTRNAATQLRLRDGETQLLAGLISKQDRSTTSGLPGLADLPLVSRLFSSTKDETQRTELVLAITPHVVRNIQRPDAAQAEIWVGTEAHTRVRAYGGRVPSRVEPAVDKPAAPGSAPVAAQLAPKPSPALVGPGALDEARPVKPPSVMKLGWNGPSEVKAGDEFVVTLNMNSSGALRGTPMQIEFDKERLAVLDVKEGDFFKRGGALTSFTKSIQAKEGRLNVGVMRNQANGATGQSDVVAISFRATKPGPAKISLNWLEVISTGDDAGKAVLPVVHSLTVN